MLWGVEIPSTATYCCYVPGSSGVAGPRCNLPQRAALSDQATCRLDRPWSHRAHNRLHQDCESYAHGCTSCQQTDRPSSGCASKSKHRMAPGYLADLCRPVSSIDSHRHLRPAERGQLGLYGFCRPESQCMEDERLDMPVIHLEHSSKLSK